MSVTLQITAGPHSGRKIVVPRGQIVLFGRTRWADQTLEADTAMADVHFAVDFRATACKIVDRTGKPATLVNGQPATELQLHSGDIVEAGMSKFSVNVQGEPMPGEADIEDPNEPKFKTSKEMCAHLNMSATALGLLKDRQRPVEYFDLLVGDELYSDAVRFLAYWLPKPMAVAWACRCVESVFATTLQGQDARALARASDWAADPTEANRRAAEAAAEEVRYEGPAGFLAAAAFWSGGSLAPPGIAEVPPPPGLTAQTILAALLMTAPYGNPLKAKQRYQDFLQDGKTLAVSLPEA